MSSPPVTSATSLRTAVLRTAALRTAVLRTAALDIALLGIAALRSAVVGTLRLLPAAGPVLAARVGALLRRRLSLPAVAAAAAVAVV